MVLGSIGCTRTVVEPSGEIGCAMVIPQRALKQTASTNVIPRDKLRIDSAHVCATFELKNFMICIPSTRLARRPRDTITDRGRSRSHIIIHAPHLPRRIEIEFLLFRQREGA